MGLKPGRKASRSGQYQQVGPRGGKGKEVTVVKGEPLPPTPKIRDDLQAGRCNQEQVWS